MAAGDPFSFIARSRIDEALAGFDQQTGLAASVYVGATDRGRGADGAPTDIDEFADRALAELPHHPGGVVLLVVDPGRRQTVVRTDRAAHTRLTDESCGLATLSMTTSFGAGDLVGGIVVGLRMLGDSTAPARVDLHRPTSTSSTVTRR